MERVFEGDEILGSIHSFFNIESMLFDTMILSPSILPLKPGKSNSVSPEDLKILLDFKKTVKRDVTRVRESLRDFRDREDFWFSDHCYAWTLWIRECLYFTYRILLAALALFVFIAPFYIVKWLIVKPVKFIVFKDQEEDEDEEGEG